MTSQPSRSSRSSRQSRASRSPGRSADRPTGTLLDVRDLRVWYGTSRGPVRAVDGVSLELRPGEVLGLVGESGCGKSTLGRALLGLLPEGAAVGGEIRFKDRDLVAMSRKELHALRGPELGLIFQEPMTRLNPLMKISQHFAETLKTHHPGLSKREIRERTVEALRHVGIPPSRVDNFPHEFSGGMRQRIMIALALVLRPAFVVADEPTTALDVLVEAQILRLLAGLRVEADTSMLLITHNLGIVAETCDRVAVMYAGKIVELGDARDVFAEPQHPYTRELLRSTISLSTTGLHYIPGAPPDLADPPASCRFHPRCPEAMRVCADVEPIEMRLGGGRRVLCWLHGPHDKVPAGGTERLEREAISVADEA
jgi:peptide/nickel transport system ATP-binding protein